MNDALLLGDRFSSIFMKLQGALPQSLLLVGEYGSGIGTVASNLPSQILARIEPTDSDGNPDKNGSISVDAIRALYEQTRGRSAAQRAVIIDDADRMTPQAQEAFLKLLEEPSSHTHFILTAHQADKLLPTIRSRVQTVVVPRISEQMSRDLLASHELSEAEVNQILFVAAGRPAALQTLAADAPSREKTIQLIKDARRFVSGKRFDQLRTVADYKDRTRAIELIDSCILLLEYTLQSTASVSMIAALELLLDIRESISRNAHIRTQLMRFVLQ